MREVTRRIECDDFKGSNGWLDCCKKCYNVRQMKVVSQVMCLVLLLIDGKKGFQIFYQGKMLRIYGILMRLAVFGKLCLTRTQPASKSVGGK